MKESPNQNTRPAPVSAIVLHCDAASDAKASASWILSPQSKVSYHVLIDRDGTTYHFVPVEKRAWHAGVSTFQGVANCNDYSIGLSFANTNKGEPYTEAQLDVAAALCKEWMVRFPAITRERVTTHAIVAPGRKTDPLGFDLAAFKARL